MNLEHVDGRAVEWLEVALGVCVCVFCSRYVSLVLSVAVCVSLARCVWVSVPLWLALSVCVQDKCAQLQLELRQKMHEMGSMQGRMQAIHQLHSPHGSGTALSPPRSTWPWYCTLPLHDHFTLPLYILARITMEMTQIARQITSESLARQSVTRQSHA